MATPRRSRARDGYRPGYEIVAERIVDYIAAEGLGPGARLPTEKRLAELLSVSHTVAREALRTLAAQGRVSMRRGAGIFVATPPAGVEEVTWGPQLLASLDHMKMMAEYRCLLEPGLARIAAERATPKDVREIGDLAARGIDDIARSDGAAFAVTDELFHQAVAAATKNDFMIRALNSVIVTRRPIPIVKFKVHHGAEEHVRIADAIRRGEPDEAAQQMHDHIADSLVRYTAEVDKIILDPDS